ncbi:type VI secretion system protein TssA [Aquitalea sp. LB_tupeE]|uniref:type VI secretion system protein TssA n=1 Tax=Aquitalea sp. LB_tupeE TaxID=2748078 RepID=UPI0015BF2D2F|nr:type VI secretion system protein TssA [Aquitalea sp. LB_tupeE]NWK78835.1 type VI secretion system protein TssA [Aquitalea sp. LB_tupeE]
MKPDWLTRLIRQDSSGIADTAMPAAISALLQPCQTDQPCGEDVGQQELFLQLKDNLSRLSGLDCLALEQDCRMLLQQGKDLRPAVYLVYAWTRQHGWNGLYQGLEFLGALTQHYGQTLYPVRAAARHAILGWLGSSKVLDWLQSLDTPSPPLRQAVQQQLDTLAGQWSDHGIALRDAWDGLHSMLATFDSDSTLDGATAPAATQTVHQAGEKVIASSQMLLEQLRAMCSYLRQQPHGAFAAFRLARVVRWDSIAQPPPHDGLQRTRLPAPRPELRQTLTRLLLQKQWHALLEKADSAFLESANHFWLDLQYLAWQALGQLGESHQHWRDIALSDIALMRHRLCGIEQLCFADGSPFADDNTLEWLASQAVVYDLSGGDKPWSPPLISVAAADLTDIGQQARLLAEQQGLEAALGWLQALPRPPGLRQQAQQLLLTAQLAESCGRSDIALGIVHGLEQELCSQEICRWDPELVFDIKASHLQLLRQRGRRKDADKQTLQGQMQRLQQDMSLLNPLRTALLSSQ